MFGLGKKAKKRKWVISSASTILGIQLTVARGCGDGVFDSAKQNPFFHGYMIGFIDSLLQMAEISDQKECLDIMKEVYETVFFHSIDVSSEIASVAATTLLEVHLSDQLNEVFRDGLFRGGNEAQEFLSAGTKPFGLATFVRNGDRGDTEKVIVVCGNYAQKLRVPAGKRLMITCTKCQHKFEEFL